MGNIHIIIGDAHDKPETNKRRFRALGNFILDLCKKNRQSHITTIDMGDFEDMPSLSHFDKGKLEFEGRRYTDDIESAFEARSLVYLPINKWTDEQKSSHRRTPKLLHFALGGNHFEGRINRFVQDNPELHGLLTNEHASYKTFRVNYIPYLVPKNIDGLQYVHYWQQRASQRPIGVGKYPAAAILREKMCSTVVGHSHVLDRAVCTTGNSERIYALSSGCFLDPDERENYAGQGNEGWWKGIIVLYDVENGYPHGGEQFIPVRKLLDDYL